MLFGGWCTEDLEVWSDEPWLFYRHLWDQEQIGFASHFTELPQTFDHIAADIHKLEERHSHELKLSG